MKLPGFGSRKKEKEKEFNKLLTDIAYKQADVQPGIISKRLKDTLTGFLYAEYALSADSLPMAFMEENCYYQSCEYISQVRRYMETCGVKARIADYIEIDSFQLENYDKSITYAVTDINYNICYTATGRYLTDSGEYPFKETGRIAAHYLYDTRMGWIAGEFKHLPL